MGKENKESERGLAKKVADAVLGAAAGSASGVVEGGVLFFEGPFHDCGNDDFLPFECFTHMPITLLASPLWVPVLALHASVYYPKSCAESGWNNGVEGIKDNLRVSEVQSSFFNPLHRSERVDFAEKHCANDGMGCLKNGDKDSFMGKGYGWS